LLRIISEGGSAVTADPQPGPHHAWREDDPELRAKVQSKTHVATFLAGFVFAALVEILMSEEKSAVLWLAALFLTAALGLFVTSIYLYDQLNMPSRYWTHIRDAPEASRLQRLGATLHERVLRREQARRPNTNLAYDRVYAHMVSTWMMVFTPALVCAVVGFMILLFRRDMILGVLGVSVLACTMLYYWTIRPRLTID
jgi:uncharacterized MAPEG superfamily protein